MGQPVGRPRQAGIGFAIRTALISQLEQRPQGLSPRLMTMKLHLKRGRSSILISAYAPTMSNDNLNFVLQTVPFKDRLLLGDINARVGRDAQTWLRVLGQHSVGNENFNGSLLLQTCSEHELAITNTYFQQANKNKTTWQHPRSKHWHMIHHVISRQRHLKEVHSTRAMRGTGMWSDHRLDLNNDSIKHTVYIYRRIRNCYDNNRR